MECVLTAKKETLVKLMESIPTAKKETLVKLMECFLAAKNEALVKLMKCFLCPNVCMRYVLKKILHSTDLQSRYIHYKDL